jgi:hypothetical protein
MIRLQRVTFLALHDYLGLTTELTRSSDDTSQIQTSHRRRSHTHPNLVSNIAPTSIDRINSPEDDLIDNENFRSSQLIASASDQSQITPTPDLINSKNLFENIETPITTERNISIPISTKKRSTNFAGLRSMSVVDSRQLKPDFEEAAARARVKNSLDTTIFQKHKLSYPKVSSNRLSNTSSTRRRSSFSDVKIKIFFSLNFLFIFLISLIMEIFMQDH